ncbi:MAG TPA: methyltransferase domain-containing protein [Solirubrobacteraceae bacterium]
MTGYVLATDADEIERRRMGLLFAYHGPLTIEVLTAAEVSRGWRCLDIGAGGGDITRWLAKRVAPGGSVVAVDLETHWIEPLAGGVVEVRRGDFGQLDLGPASFDLVVTQMLLLHLPNPAEACRRLVELAAPARQIVIHDADFTPLVLAGATASEAAGLAVMPEVMRAAGIDLALGPKVAGLLEAAGARVEQVETRPGDSPEEGRIAGEICAITIERFRDRTEVPGEAIDAALAALRDPERLLTGPTKWAVRARVAA